MQADLIGIVTLQIAASKEPLRAAIKKLSAISNKIEPIARLPETLPAGVLSTPYMQSLQAALLPFQVQKSMMWQAHLTLYACPTTTLVPSVTQASTIDDIFCMVSVSYALLRLHYVGALCNELWGCVQERELQADLQQLLAQLVAGAGQPQGLPALLLAVQQTAKRVLGQSCAVASFSPADSAQLQLLSWLADAQVLTLSCNLITPTIVPRISQDRLKSESHLRWEPLRAGGLRGLC